MKAFPSIVFASIQCACQGIDYGGSKRAWKKSAQKFAARLTSRAAIMATQHLSADEFVQARYGLADSPAKLVDMNELWSTDPQRAEEIWRCLPRQAPEPRPSAQPISTPETKDTTMDRDPSTSAEAPRGIFLPIPRLRLPGTRATGARDAATTFRGLPPFRTVFSERAAFMRPEQIVVILAVAFLSIAMTVRYILQHGPLQLEQPTQVFADLARVPGGWPGIVGLLLLIYAITRGIDRIDRARHAPLAILLGWGLVIDVVALPFVAIVVAAAAEISVWLVLFATGLMLLWALLRGIARWATFRGWSVVELHRYNHISNSRWWK